MAVKCTTLRSALVLETFDKSVFCLQRRNREINRCPKILTGGFCVCFALLALVFDMV